MEGESSQAKLQTSTPCRKREGSPSGKLPLKKYKPEPKTTRLEDVFQEILKAFAKMTDFKMFARSNNGLSLEEFEIQQIVDNNADVVDQKMALLNLWREMNGEEATPSKIRSLATGYHKGSSNDYIKLCNGTFGIFKNQPLCKKRHVFLGEQVSRVTGSKHCAIKLIPYDEENLREAQILTELKGHENVVLTIHTDLYSAELFDYIFLVMELFWSKQLREILENCKQSNKPLEESTAIDIAMQILRALVFIHEHNVLHRDLKPENVLISEDMKHLKIADFGLSKTIDDGLLTKQTTTNIGTDGYRAKETYIENKKISRESDIFSAGVILAEIFSSGRHPYGDDQHLWSYNIKNDKNLDLRNVVISNRTQAKKLLRWMLKPDPEERPSAEEVLSRLKMLEHSQISVREESVVPEEMEHSMLGDNWKDALKEEFNTSYFENLNRFVMDERENHLVYPPHEEVFEWSRHCTIQDVKVVIVGTDPYTDPGLAHGLCFSTRYPNPPSQVLQNIFAEIESEIPEFKRPEHGDLTGWAKQGVLLLNSVLTVREGSPGSHKDKGWEKFTDAVIKYMCDNCSGVLFLLWGYEAQNKARKICRNPHYVLDTRASSSASSELMYAEKLTEEPKYVKNSQGVLIPKKPHYICRANHPEHEKFYIRSHFSLVKQVLQEQKRGDIDWRLPPQ